ncbi:26830_t:CDS:2, partial [Dentiscutata erythropus]
MNVISTNTIDVQNVTSINTMDIQNGISTDSVTSSSIPVSPAADNTTTATATSLTTSSRNTSAVWNHFTLLSNKLKDKLCFQFVEKPNFHKILSGILPCFSMSANTVKQDVMKGYDKRKNLIRTILQNAESRISLTCDVWTSLQQLEYLTITAYFLDEKWNLISLLISFELLSYPHTGANIGNCIKTVTDNYLITTKIQTITLDNASLNDVAICKLINSASQDLINIKKELFHNHCLAHILNLIVKDRLKKFQSFVKAIHTTPKRHQIFLE